MPTGEIMAFIGENTKVPKTYKLNDKQKSFIEYYLRGLSATKAAEKAGYSVNTAHAQGCALMKHPEITKLIAKRQKQAIAHTNLSQAFLMNELKEIITSKEEKTTDRLKAIELAGRYLGMWDGSKSEETSKEHGYNTHARISRLIKRVA